MKTIPRDDGLRQANPNRGREAMSAENKSRHSATMAISQADDGLWMDVRTKAAGMGMSGADILVLLARAWTRGDIIVEHTVTTRAYMPKEGT